MSSGCRPCSLHHAHLATLSTVFSAEGMPDLIDAPAPSSNTGSEPSIRSERSRPVVDVRISIVASLVISNSAVASFIVTPGLHSIGLIVTLGCLCSDS